MTDTRNKIFHLERQIDRIERQIKDAKKNNDDDSLEQLALDLHEAEEQLNFAWQDDEEEYNYALEAQEFNPDGSLKYYN